MADNPAGDAGAEAVCRVCRGEATASSPLYHPCRCTGSIRYIHQECLKRWMEHSHSTSCELCGQKFMFKDVFSPTMPQKLPASAILLEAVSSAAQLFARVSRLVFVITCYGVIFPLTLRMAFRFYFQRDSWRSPSDASFVTTLLLDWLEGVAACSSMLALAFAMLTLRDFVVVNGLVNRVGDPLRVLGMPLHEGGQNEGDDDTDNELDEAADAFDEDEDDSDDHHHHHHDHDHGVVVDQDQFIEQLLRENRRQRRRRRRDEMARLLSDDDEEDEEEEHGEGENRPAQQPAAARGMRRRRVAAGAAAVDPLRAHQGLEDAPAPQDVINDFQALHRRIQAIEQRGGGVVNPAGAGEQDENEPEPEPEPGEAAVDNADEVLARQLAEEDDAAVEFRVLIGLEGPLNRVIWNTVWLLALSGAAVIALVLLPHLVGKACLIQVPLLKLLALNPLATVSTGWCVVLSIVFGRLLVNGRLFDRTSGTRHLLGFLGAFAKVVSLMLLEIVIVPVQCGWWIDICTLQVQGKALQSRLDFHVHAPWTSTLLHWLVGILFMHNFANFISLLRRHLRKGVLWFFRDPDDPAFHPVKYILDTNLLSYALRLCSVILLYDLTIILLFYLPSATLMALVPTAVPLRLYLTHPAELLGYNLLLPLLFESTGPPQSFETAIKGWLQAASGYTGLREMFLPAENDNRNMSDVASPRLVEIRIVALLALGTLSSYLAVSACVVVPVVVGRTITQECFGIELHDVFTIVGGGFVSYMMARGLLALFSSPQVILSAVNTFRRFVSLIRASLNTALHVVAFLVVLPLLTGVVSDMCIFRLVRTGFDSTTSLFTWYNWVGGCFVLKIMHQAVLAGPESELKRQVEQLGENGLRNVDLSVVRKVASPLLFGLAGLLSLFTFVHFRSNTLIALPVRLVHALYRVALPMLLACGLGFAVLAQAKAWLVETSNQVRRKRYLIYQRLLNAEEATQQTP